MKSTNHIARALEHPWKQLSARIRADITSGQFLAGKRLPSVRSWMQETGRSSATVQAALRALMEEGLIESRPGSGCYLRAPVRAATNQTIVAVLPTFSSPNEEWFIAPLLFSMVHAATGAKLSLTLAQHYNQAQPPHTTNASVVQDILASRPHGVAWVHAFGDEAPELQQFTAAGIPIVTTMRRLGKPAIPIVREDDAAYARLVVEQLASRGHRSLAIIGTEYGDEYYESKFAALVNAGRRGGLTVRRDDWLQQGVAQTPLGADPAMIAQFLEKRPHVTALLVLFSFAIGPVMQLFHSPLGDRLKRLTILHNELDAVATPRLPTGESLATLAQPAAAMGERIIATLTAQIAGRDYHPATPLVPVFTAGDSVRPAATAEIYS